jgi:hypothetical protein
MKSLYLRSGLALLCTVILSACGGSGGGDLPLQVTVVGLNKTGLVLINKPTGEKLTITGSGTYAFTKLVSVDEQFDIQIDTPATGAKCVLSENTGKANVYTYGRAGVTCASNPWTLGGAVDGLTGKGLVLANGSDTVSVPPSAVAGANVLFTFPSKVADGSAFGATVLLQPEGQTCVVDPKNNPGVMPGSDALGLEVHCKPN